MFKSASLLSEQSTKSEKKFTLLGAISSTDYEITFKSRLTAPEFNVFSSHVDGNRSKLPAVHGKKFEDLWSPDYDKNYKIYSNFEIQNIMSNEKRKRMHRKTTPRDLTSKSLK
jgi:hypothetical protein